MIGRQGLPMTTTASFLPRRRFRLAPITPIGCEQPVSKTLPAAVARIVAALQPEKIILFGSYA